MREAVIVDAVRTPLGKGKPTGQLAGWHPADLLASTLEGLVERSGFDAAELDDVIAGCGSQVGEQAMNVARNALLGAGFPERVPGTTLDRQCGSSQQAVHFAAQGVMSGAYDAVVACGVEMMSRVPMFSSLQEQDPFGSRVAERYGKGLVNQGISAELIAARFGLDRKELDELAVESHRRADEATREGRFSDELLPLTDEGGAIIAVDEGIRPETTLETLSALKPAFVDEEIAERFSEIDWSITAGNSSQITDGASALLIMERSRAEGLGLRPRARLHSFSVVGDDPVMMLTAIIPATRDVLGRAGLSVDEIDVFEVNEAFASVVLAWQRELGVPQAKVNVNGGAMALGHPIGASGARLMTTLVNALEQQDARWGLQTMCEGGGMANATVVERLS